MKDKLLAYLNTVLLITILGYLFVYQKQTGRFIYIPDQRIKIRFGSMSQEKIFDTQSGILYTRDGTKWVVASSISDDSKIETNHHVISQDSLNSESIYNQPDTISN